MKHDSSGKCKHCQELFEKYPNFNKAVRAWFEDLQMNHPEAHISCAGRGRNDQEEAFKEGTSRAHYGESSHNYNCAVDIFVEKPGLDLYDRDWFDIVASKDLPNFISWYGKPGSVFFELPHFELKSWKDLKTKGLIKLVEFDI